MRAFAVWIGAVLLLGGLESSTLVSQGLADEPAAPSRSSEVPHGAGVKEARGAEAVPPVVEGQPSPPVEAGDVRGRAGMHDHRTSPGTVTPSPPTPASGEQPLPLPSNPAPTLNLAAVANAMRYDYKSLSTVVTVPFGLPLSKPVTISIGYFPSGVVGYGSRCQQRATQTYTSSVGNTFLCALPEGDGQPRHLHLDITLSEPKPGGGVFSYNVPVEMDLDPLYDVTISPLTFTLIRGCDVVGANQIDLYLSAPDNTNEFWGQTVHFATKEREVFVIREFSWARSEVSAAANLHKEDVLYEQIGVEGPIGFHPQYPHSTRIPLVPGKTHRSNQGLVAGNFASSDCRATLDYTVTYTFRGYFGAAPDMRGVAAALGSPITAVARTPNYLDLFVTGADGGIYSTWWDGNGAWNNWFSVSGGAAALGSPITAVARTPNHLDLFVTGADGNIYSTWWDANGGWGTWFNVAGGRAALGSRVEVASLNPNHLQLFVTGTDGNIYSTWWDANGGWAKWFSVSGGSAALGSPITAVVRNPNHLDLFVTGADGNIYSTWWDANGGWAKWVNISGEK